MTSSKSPLPGCDPAPAGKGYPSPGQKPLRGAEWRAAVKAASRKSRRPAAPRKPAQPSPEPPADGDRMTATAHCILRCGWTAGPGPWGEVDKVAAAHTEKPPKHPTGTVAWPREAA